MSAVRTHPVTITYLDGTVESVQATQADVAAFERWTVGKGLFAPKGVMLHEAMPSVFTRYLAYSAVSRGSDTRQSFEAWDKTVSIVEGESEPVDPTQTATSDEPLPPSPSASE